MGCPLSSTRPEPGAAAVESEKIANPSRPVRPSGYKTTARTFLIAVSAMANAPLAGPVTWTIECSIDPADLPQVRQLAAHLSHLCLHQEPDNHGYEWSVDPSGSIVHIFERYADSQAAMVHIRLFEEQFADRFRALLRPVRVVLIGSPSAELRAALAAFSPLVLESLVGFHR